MPTTTTPHELNGRFQVWLRRRQVQAIYPLPDGAYQNVIVQCDPLTGAAQYIPGNVNNTSPFYYPSPQHDDIAITPVDGWYDFTNYIEGLEKLSFTWDKVNTGDKNVSAETNPDGSNYDKGITSDLMFFDAAQSFVEKWLMDTQCQILNCVEVRIVDLVARETNPDPTGNYRIFEIKVDNIEYAPVDEPCQIHVRLREQDTIWHCIHKTVIWDNWQNWFNATGTSAFEHPCFLTCIEPRPRLVNSIRMALAYFFYSNPALAAMFWITGDGIENDAMKILNADRFIDAPLVYTYILNVAGKCDMLTDTIFNPGQEWENLCLYYPQAGEMKENNDADTVASPDQLFTYGNRWLVTLADLLDKLKVLFCAEWYVTPNNTIVFKYIKDLIQLAPIYDYTAVGAEPIYHLRYTFNGDKKPAFGRYQYGTDGSDLASQEIDTLYSDIIDYDGSANNPMLEGEKDKNFDFAATGFVRDGRAPDYMRTLINDGEIGALILVGIFAATVIALAAGVTSAGAAAAMGILIIAPYLAAILINHSRLKNIFIDDPTFGGAVRLTCEQTMMPRLLLWDGVSMQRAKTDARIGLPVPNPYFNPSLTPYQVKNDIGVEADGTTTDRNPNGAIYNYPTYFDGDYYGNMYPKFHDQVDNPLKSIETHQKGTFEVDLCTAQLNLYGVFQNQYAQIGKIVKVEDRPNYEVFIRIGNIEVDYDDNKIVISGNVIRKPADNVTAEGEGDVPVVIPEQSSPPPTPTGICYKWKNTGTQDTVVSYMDCSTIILTEILAPGQRICALEVFSATPQTLSITDACAGSEASGSASGGSGLPPEGCIAKVYRARIRMNFDTGDIDSVEVFENAIGDIVWTHTGTGSWTGTLVGGLPSDFTWYQGNNPLPNAQGFIAYRKPTGDDDTVVIETFDPAGDNQDYIMGESAADIEIIVYCPPVVDCEETLFGAVGAFAAGLGDYTSFGLGYTGDWDVNAPYPVTIVSSPSNPDWIPGFDQSDNGDGTTHIFFGTSIPDGDTAPAGTYTISFDINGCTVSKAFQVVQFGEFSIFDQVSFIEGETTTQQIHFDFLATIAPGAFVVWGDGVVDPIPEVSGVYTLSHTYPAIFDSGFQAQVYFTANEQIFTLENFSGSPENFRQEYFQIDGDLTNLSGIVFIARIMDTGVIILSGNPTVVSLDGHNDSVQTNAYFGSIPASISYLTLENYPAMTDITGIPSTVDGSLFLESMPNLVNANYPVGLLCGDVQSLGVENCTSNPNLGVFTYTNITTFIFANNNMSTSQINTFLVGLDGNGFSNGTAVLTQGGGAPPSGAGATAKASLIGKGWTVLTD